MHRNLARLLNELGIGLTAIAAMSKLPNVSNRTARKWCDQYRLPPKARDALARGALPLWGKLKREQHPRSTELWQMMAIAEHPNICHVMVYVCDVPEHFIAAAAGVTQGTVNKWLYKTEFLSDNVKDRLAGLYRETMNALERDDDPRDVILEKAWRRKKPPRSDSALAYCLDDYHTHCYMHWTRVECRNKLEELGHHRSVVYQALKHEDLRR